MLRYLKGRHVVNNYFKFQMNCSQKLDSFQKNERQIRNQWRKIYSLEYIHREYSNLVGWSL